MDLIVDSCVVISGVIVEDVLHEPAKNFFANAAARGDVTWAPATMLWDISMRFVHPKKLLEIGSTTDDEIRLGLRFMPVTSELFHATQATHLRWDGSALSVVRSSITGPDQIFLSCALSKRAPLITWDTKIRDQAFNFGVVVATPEQYIAGEIKGATRPVPTDEEIMAMIQRRVTGGAAKDLTRASD
jgi:hypothetical protein